METILKSDLDKGVKLGEIEVFTAEQIKSYVEQSNDAIEKSIGDKDALRSEVATEVKSFRPIKVWDDTTLEKSIQFIRPAQIKWDEPTGDDISKSRSGTYMNTPENRKKGIVGNKYGHEKKEGEPDIKDMMKRGLHAADNKEKEEKDYVLARDLKEGEKYTWFMGAEPLECTYEGPGEKPYTYKFKIEEDTSTHTLSIKDVKDYIKPLSYMQD